MSNPSTPYGFRLVGLKDGTMPTFGTRSVQIATNNTHSIYGGDVAAVISAGFYDVATVTGGGAPIGGVFLPYFSWQSVSAGMRLYSRAWLGNTGDLAVGSTISAMIICNPDAQFIVRSTGASGNPIVQANVGENANFAVGAGPGNNLISTFGLDDSTLGSGASLPFRVVDIVQPPESDPTSLYNEVIVIFNNLTQ